MEPAHAAPLQPAADDHEIRLGITSGLSPKLLHDTRTAQES